MPSSDTSHPDPDALREYLAPRLAEFHGPLTIRAFADGQSNPTFLIETPGDRYVLRRKPPGQLLQSAHAVDREYRVIRALRDSEVPVPRALLLCTDAAVIGSDFYLMSHEPGDIFWDPALPALTPDQRGARYHALIDTLAALHKVDHEALGLADFGRSGNYFARQLNRWTRQYHASATDDYPEMEKLIDWLERHMPEDDGQNGLIHGDFRLDNVIFHADQPNIRVVLDWELATTGHPMADLAYYCMALRMPGEGEIRGLQGIDRRRAGIPEEGQLLERYRRQRGLDRIENWSFCLAFSFFRLAAILQGVYRRGLDGNASSARATRMGGLVQPLAAMGLAVSREAD